MPNKLLKLAHLFEVKLAQQYATPNQTKQIQFTPLQKIKRGINQYRLLDTNYSNALVGAKVQMPLVETNARDVNYYKAVNLLKVFLGDITDLGRQMSDEDILNLLREKVKVD